MVTPTRELALQILREFQRLSKGKKFRAMVLSKANAGSKQSGGHGSQTSANGQQSQQSRALAATDLVVTTPMRLVHLIRRGGIDVSGVQSVVLDGHRLFEEGSPDQTTILGAGNKPRQKTRPRIMMTSRREERARHQNVHQYSSVQRAMFSATMPQGIEEMIQTVLRHPVRKRVGSGSPLRRAPRRSTKGSCSWGARRASSWPCDSLCSLELSPYHHVRAKHCQGAGALSRAMLLLHQRGSHSC